jgi:hypothetical protein
VGPVFPYLDQAVTVDRAVDIDRGLAGPDASPDHLPITLRPGGARMIYLAIRYPTDESMSPGQSVSDRVTLRVRTLGITRTEDFPFEFGTGPVWIGISGFDAQTPPCDFNTPATAAQ